MRTIRSLAPFVACAVLLLVANSASAAWYTFAGRLTTNRGRNTNVPMAGTQTCGSLTVTTGPVMTMLNLMEGMVVRGVNTQPPGAVTTGFNWKIGMDQRCVKAVRPLMTTGKGVGVGAAFTLPPRAFYLPYPNKRHPAHYMFKTDIPVVEVKNFPPAIQLATSVKITAAPTNRLLGPKDGGTQCVAGPMGTCTNVAKFRAFKAGAWATQTGRGAAKFSWCPPPVSNLAGPGVTGCTGTGVGGFPAIITYTGGGNAFGGTMSLVTHQLAGVGSLGLGAGGGAVAFNNFGGGESLATGRGYADYNKITIPSGDIHAAPTIMTRYIGPILGSQKVIGMVGAKQPGMFAAGKIYDWGFPWTTMTVVVQAFNANMTRGTTVTAMGWDCAGNMEGPACSKVPAKGVPPGTVNRNISLVSGAIGFARLPLPFGDAPIANMGNMQLLVMPEPRCDVAAAGGRDRPARRRGLALAPGPLAEDLRVRSAAGPLFGAKPREGALPGTRLALPGSPTKRRPRQLRL